MSAEIILRASVFHMLADPASCDEDNSFEYFHDGALWIKDGYILAVGSFEKIVQENPTVGVRHYQNALICPGFIDTHIHYPQVDVIASYGEDLIGWLNNYTFPTEAHYKDSQVAQETARWFIQELLRNGTTSALVFATVHRASVEAFFETAADINLRMICGKVLMDRNAPDFLLDTADQSYFESKQLIEKWHGRQRLRYAVTPRFAITSTPEQLSAAGRLLTEYPDVYLHTHLSESKRELAWVKELFPDQQDYLGVYQQHGLLTDRSVFAHGVQLSEDESRRLGENGAALAFCPTSNLFLGSGLFNLSQQCRHNVSVGLGTDVGGGTSFSQLQTMAEAYKVIRMGDDTLSPLMAFYLATLGGARALNLQNKIGNFQAEKEADFIILDLNATPLLTRRMQSAQTIGEKLFALMMLGDDRAIKETWSMGRPVHLR